MVMTCNRKKSNDLVCKSSQILGEKDLASVWQAGIRRDPKNYHITVMYPPLKVMDSIDGDHIFSDFENNSRNFTLYIHIPFCSGKCTFCYFYQIEKPVEDLIASYLKALKKEIALIAGKIKQRLGRVSIQSVFFGGGSPTVLSGFQFKDLMQFIKRHFFLSEETELTVEIHPEIIRRNGNQLLRTYREIGVNRLNIGIQSFNDPILKLTNRRHTAQEAIEVYQLARKAGFSNINLDLLYPLPDLTPEIWEDTLHTAFSLDPDSVTTYFMAIRKCSPIYRMLQNAPERFPDETLNHLFRIMTIEKAKSASYDHRKLVDWFVKPRDHFHYRHQQNEAQKTEEVQLLSFGSGVFSYINNHQYYNIPDIRQYCDRLQNNELPIWKGIHLSKEERFARAMVLGIKSGCIDTRKIEQQFQTSIPEKYNTLLNRLEQLDLLEKMNGTIQLSDKGVLFADEIAVQFITESTHERLQRKTSLPIHEKKLIENYNFMYDMDGLSFLQ